jgi:uncharacterized membrane protein YhaH (DUF805 family)
MQFGLGYMALCFFGAVVMQIVLFTIASLIGSLEAVFDHPEWMTPLFLLLIPILWGLIAGRAHDLGWPAWPIIALFLLPWPAWAVVMDGALGVFGGAVVTAVGDSVPFAVLNAAIFIPAALYLIALIVLAAVPGQKQANRFGDQPAPGLWNDLPKPKTAPGS